MKKLFIPIFLGVLFFGIAAPVSAETCSWGLPVCSEVGYECKPNTPADAAPGGHGTCVPKTTCTSADPTCPAGKVCKMTPRTSSGICGTPSVGGEEPTTPAPTNGLVNPLNASSIEELLAIVLHTLVQIGTIILILMLVWTGFMFVSAQGNEEKIRTARAALLWTVLGGLVLLGAEAISLVIKATVESL